MQHPTTHCNTLQHTATHCNTLQHTATHCNALQHTATHCSTLQRNTLQRTPTHSNTLQHTPTHSNTLSRTATHRQSRYGTWTTKCGECLWFVRVGAIAETLVADLIIEDGVPSHGHRLCIFYAKYAVASARVGVHATFGCMVVVEFAGEFVSDDALVAARQVDTRKRDLNAFR